jgi:hypothetical protein
MQCRTAGAHVLAHSTRCDAEFSPEQQEQQVEKSVFSKAALMRFRRNQMKKLFILAAAASLVATMANAQTTITTETTTGAAGATVRIEPEYRTRIKSYVTEHKIRPVETRERIVVGAKVPTDVELTAVPSDWGPSVTKYRYVYSNNRVMLVDPATRTVVHEVD